MEPYGNHQEELKKIKGRIKDIRVAIMTTISAEGKLHSRPMATNEMEEDGSLWFFTDQSSEKVSELSHDNVVSLSYSNPDDNTYVCLTGEAEVVDDRKKMKELFNPMVKAWYPKGLDDPDMTLLKVIPQDAEYWDGSSSKMVVAFNMLKAVVTGKEYDEGEHGKISL
ncbi:MAG: pyridoxamine 5'-phosphate oxidase family protein [Sphingobacteriaceae bacterium]|nr:pyridoxamine 5'-phosphate oxidase family protein [Cytophagaceae bacterium]